MKWMLFHGRVNDCVVVQAHTGRQLSTGAGFFTLVLSDSDSVAMILERAGRIPMPWAALKNTCSQLFFMGGAKLRK